MLRRAALLLLLAVSTAANAQTPVVRPEWTSDATSWDSGGYAYDGAGNIVRIGTDTYAYDALGRLNSATARTPSSSGNAQTFTYDRFGNLTKITTVDASTRAAVFAVNTATNQLNGACAVPHDICYTGVYDAVGNQTGLVAGDNHYQWDSLAIMTGINLPGRAERYIYDANDERIVRINANTSVRLYTLRGSDEKIVREIAYDPVSASPWVWRKDYVFRDGVLLATYVAGEAGPGPHRHYHVDHLGTPRLITDAAGYKRGIHTYWPFGVEAWGSAPDYSERLQFTGHERDVNNDPAAVGEGLDYMHARYYAPIRGRFLSVDPEGDSANAKGPQSWNRYSYVLNNPLKAVDKSGRRPALVFGRTLNVEPGFVIVFGKKDSGQPNHVAMVVGFNRGPQGELTAKIVEHVPREGNRMARHTERMLPDKNQHKLVVVDANSPQAGGQYWNADQNKPLAVIPNRTLSGAFLTENAASAAVNAINARGGLTYDPDQAGTNFGTRTDCAGAVDQLLDLLGGTLDGGGPHGHTYRDFLEMAIAIPVF